MVLVLVLVDSVIGEYWYWTILVLVGIGIGRYWYWSVLVLVGIGIGRYCYCHLYWYWCSHTPTEALFGETIDVS